MYDFDNCLSIISLFFLCEMLVLGKKLRYMKIKFIIIIVANAHSDVSMFRQYSGYFQTKARVAGVTVLFLLNS